MELFKKRIYMDYAAGAPQLPVVRRAVARAERLFGNPSSIHVDGVYAREAIEQARRNIAAVLHAQKNEIIFTSTGTESDNLAILGVFEHAIKNGFGGKPHIITLETEHPTVMKRYEYLERNGADVTYVSVGEDGCVDPKVVRAALRPETILVSIMYANNEIGVIQPVREIVKELRHYKKRSETESQYPLFHTDACQATHYLNMNVEQLGVDLLTFSGVKIGGGHGAAVLYVRKDTPIDPVFFGGDQERGLRPGTENGSAIVGLATALLESEKIKEKEIVRLTQLRDYFFSEIQKQFPFVRINGTLEQRLPNNVHVSFPNIVSDLLVLELDAKGISASSASACDSAKDSGSQVLKALYGEVDGKKWGSVRFSLGKETTKRDVDFVVRSLVSILKKYESWK
jgi:cysteine desulfurase